MNCSFQDWNSIFNSPSCEIDLSMIDTPKFIYLLIIHSMHDLFIFSDWVMWSNSTNFLYNKSPIRASNPELTILWALHQCVTLWYSIQRKSTLINIDALLICIASFIAKFIIYLFRGTQPFLTECSIKEYIYISHRYI